MYDKKNNSCLLEWLCIIDITNKNRHPVYEIVYHKSMCTITKCMCGYVPQHHTYITNDIILKSESSLFTYQVANMTRVSFNCYTYQ